VTTTDSNGQTTTADAPRARDGASDHAPEPFSAAQVQQQLDAFKTDLSSLKTTVYASSSNALDGFFNSGIFFILLGVLFLCAAYAGLSIGVHTSFSFVLVVLGVAILLFGTGTQGLGKLESNTAAANYNVAIAGGAGALALAIGFGMIHYGPQMQRAFDVETRYVIATLRPNPDGSSNFNDYWAEFEIDGVPIPSVRRGNAILAFVPYIDTQPDATKHVWYRLRPQDPRIISANFKPVVSDTFDLPLAKVNRLNRGSDFPSYDDAPPVDMRSSIGVNAVLQAAASQKLPAAVGATEPNPTLPAALEVQ
jgi:hypothetical protein